MRPFLGSFLRFSVISLGLTAAAGCYEHTPGGGNGDTGALEFSVQGDRTNASLAATGFQVEVDITRTDAQWEKCTFSKSTPNGSTRVQDDCSSNTEPISFIDASCDDGACTVTPVPNTSGYVGLLVTGTHDGVAKLHVDVKSTTSSATWGDSFPLTFSTATKLTVKRSNTEDVRAGFALMPGASFSWCPSLADANGNVLVEAPSSITNSASGAAIAIDQPSQYDQTANCVAFHVTTPGASSVTFNAQSLSETESVSVADPNDIVAVELREFLDSPSDTDGGAGTTDGGSAIASTAATLINLTTDDFYGASYASVLTMKDGSHALGGAGFYTSSSDETVSVYTNDTDPQMARTSLSVTSSSEVIGDGTIDATIGAVKISIPFHVTMGASQTDGGN